MMKKVLESKCQWMAVNRIKVWAPFKDLFPINPTITARVMKHMKANGYDQSQPVVLWKEKLEEDRNQAIVIDGHTRLHVAKLIGLSPIYVARVSFASEDEALQYTIHNQRDRRNLDDAALMRCIEVVDKLKVRGGDRKSEAAKSKASSEAIDPGKSAEETAKVVGTSRAKVEKTRAVLKDADAKQAVLDGEKSIHAAAKETQEKRKAKSVEQAVRPEALKGWQGQCRISFKAHADAMLWKQDPKKRNVRKVLLQLSKESGMPFKILKQWWDAEEAKKAASPYKSC